MTGRKRKQTRKNAPDIGFCPKCLKMKVLTKHHVYPKRHFRDSPIFKLCRRCHDALERNIPYHKIEVELYVKILAEFIGG